MDIEQLRTFLAVHRAGGFARASELLHRSQPAISRRVALLEDALGAPLFERGIAGACLTSAGQALLRPAEKAMAALDDCYAAIEDVKGDGAGPIVMAVVGTLADAALAGVLKGFVQDAPRVALRLRTALSREVSDLVRSGEATLGVRYNADRSRDLACEQIAVERLAVACSPDHPRAGETALRLIDLQNEKWLAFANQAGGEASSGNIFAQFLTRGVSHVDWTAIDSLTAQKRLVEAGFGVALMPQSVIDEDAGRIAVLPVRDLDAFNPVCLVTRRGGYLSPAAQKLMDLLRRYHAPGTSEDRAGEDAAS